MGWTELPLDGYIIVGSPGKERHAHTQEISPCHLINLPRPLIKGRNVPM